MRIAERSTNVAEAVCGLSVGIYKRAWVGLPLLADKSLTIPAYLVMIKV